MAGTLPLDIWWLVCEELTAGLDFDGLYNFARTCRTMANFAFPSSRLGGNSLMSLGK